MKKLILKTMMIALSAGLIFTGCSSDDDDNNNNNQQTPTLAAKLEADARFSVLVEALEATNLTGTLESEGSFTVFAPTNTAFNSLFNQLGVANINEAITQMGQQTVRDILLYHVMNTEVRASDIATGYVNTMSENSVNNNLSAYIQAGGANVLINESATVTETNINARNGVAHVIDMVLQPLSVYGIVKVNPNHSNLQAALGLADGDLDELLDSAGTTFTLFAPTNAGFDTLVANTPNVSNLTELVSLIGTDGLAQALLYHTIDGDLREDDISIGQVATMAMSGGTALSFNVDINSSGTITISDLSPNSPTATVTHTNITGVNGTVHIINHVLLTQ